jgi:hypothetical protein
VRASWLRDDDGRSRLPSFAAWLVGFAVGASVTGVLAARALAGDAVPAPAEGHPAPPRHVLDARRADATADVPAPASVP